MISLLTFRNVNSQFLNIGISESGFSLMTMLIVVLAMGLFSFGLFVSMAPAIRTGQIELTYQRGQALEAALKKYKTNNPAAPATLNNLTTSTGTPCTMDTNLASSTYRKYRGWCGPYIDQDITSVNKYQFDGWGKVFQYNTTSLFSCGVNTICGDSDDISFNNF